jgi:hypothetical protein
MTINCYGQRENVTDIYWVETYESRSSVILRGVILVENVSSLDPLSMVFQIKGDEKNLLIIVSV